MLTLLLSPLGRWLTGGALILALAGGGYFYVSHLRTENARLTEKNGNLQASLELAGKFQKIDNLTNRQKEKVHELVTETAKTHNYDKLADFYNKLRNEAIQANSELGDGADSP